MAPGRRKLRQAGAAVAVSLLVAPPGAGGVAPSSASPAQSDSLPTYVFDPIEIEASAWRLPSDGAGAGLAASVVGGEALERAGLLRLADAVSGLPGVHVARFGALGSFASVSVRGTSNEQVLVLVDGRRLTSAQGGGVDLGAIDVSTLERVELLRGGASALYGPAALGGVINLVTRPAAGTRATALRLEGGSLGTAAAALRHERPAGRGGRAWVRAQGLRSDGRYDYTRAGAPGERLNAAARSAGAGAGLALGRGRGVHLILDGALESSDQGVPGTVEFPSPGARRDDRRAAGGAELLLLDRGAGTRIAATAQLARQRRRFRDPGLGVDDRHVNRSAGLELRADRALDQGRAGGGRGADDASRAPSAAREHGRPAGLLTAGIDLRRDALTSTTDGERRRRSAGLYARAVLPRGGIDVAPAVRLDLRSDGRPFLSPRGGVRLRLPAGDLRFAAGRSQRPPSFDDLFFPDLGGAAGNPSLAPERAFELDLGYGLEGAGAAAGANLFWRRIEDLIQWTPGPDGRWRPHNVGRVVSRGAELEGRVELPAGGGRRARLDGSLSLLDARNRTGEPNVDRRRLPYRPALEGRFGAAVGLAGGVSLLAAWHAVGRSYVTAANTKSVPGYGRVDLTAELAITPGAVISVAALNAGDVEAADVRDFPLPGREWRLGLRLAAEEWP